jgi:hypothetical protein
MLLPAAMRAQSDMVEPRRAIDRKLMLEPMRTKSRTEIPLLMRANERKLREEPKCTC